MTVLPTADQIRTIVHRTFLELDVDEDALHDVDERIMLDEGRYIARSYRVDDFLAMWMIDVGLVQFYDADGYAEGTDDGVNFTGKSPQNKKAYCTNCDKAIGWLAFADGKARVIPFSVRWRKGMS